MKAIKFALAALSIAALAACDRAPSNVKTLMTTDCGVTWQVINAGQRVPTSMTSCEYKTVLPDYPMQGEAEFQAQFLGNILVRVKIAYDYEIVDGLKFIKEAKFLGKASGSAAQSAAGTNMNAYETAENVVIDVRLRDITTEDTQKYDIVDFNPSAFEDKLFEKANKILESRGVRLNSMTFVMIPDEQTRLAIDSATAMNVYKSKGLAEFGQKLAIARAGSTRITVEQKDSK
jgi:hypothetical protein